MRYIFSEGQLTTRYDVDVRYVRWSSRPVFIMSRAAALLWWRFHLVIIVYHQTRPGLTWPGLTKVVLGKYPR